MTKPVNVEYKKKAAVKKGLKEAKRKKMVAAKLNKRAFQMELEKQRRKEKLTQMVNELREKRYNGMYGN